MQGTSYSITILLLVTTCLIMILAFFILFVILLHRKKQLAYKQTLKAVEDNYDKNLLRSQLEMQEQTFQHISKEIHDNISLSLTLAKLHLNTFDWNDKTSSIKKVEDSVVLLSKSITELNDISKSLDADIITQQGLLAAMESELQRIRAASPFKIAYTVTGTPVFLQSRNELIIFRIIQEAFNNILKHANATEASLHLHYDPGSISITLSDNGVGFNTAHSTHHKRAGLKNMDTRLKMLNGTMSIKSEPGKGTTLLFILPCKTNE